MYSSSIECSPRAGDEIFLGTNGDFLGTDRGSPMVKERWPSFGLVFGGSLVGRGGGLCDTGSVYGEDPRSHDY